MLPLKANLVVQEAKFNVAMADLNAAQAQLDAKQAELDKVQAVYDAAMKKKQVSLMQTSADSIWYYNTVRGNMLHMCEVLYLLYRVNAFEWDCH